MKKILLLVLLALASMEISARQYELSSPNGQLLTAPSQAAMILAMEKPTGIITTPDTV